MCVRDYVWSYNIYLILYTHHVLMYAYIYIILILGFLESRMWVFSMKPFARWDFHTGPAGLGSIQPSDIIVWLVVALPLLVSWDDYSEYMGKMFQTTNQLSYNCSYQS